MLLEFVYQEGESRGNCFSFLFKIIQNFVSVFKLMSSDLQLFGK